MTSTNNTSTDNNYTKTDSLGCSSIMDLDEILTIDIRKQLCNIKYYHPIEEDEDEEDEETYFHVNIKQYIKTYKTGHCMFSLDESNNEITYNEPVIKHILNIEIDQCRLCKKCINYEIELNKPFKLEYCSYYNDAATKIQKKWKFLNKTLPILWRIAEYYTSIKYHPNNITNYISDSE